MHTYLLDVVPTQCSKDLLQVGILRSFAKQCLRLSAIVTSL